MQRERNDASHTSTINRSDDNCYFSFVGGAMTSLELEKAIRDAVEELCRRGNSILALDLIQDIEVDLLYRVCIGKPYKSSYRAKKDGDWAEFTQKVDDLAEFLRSMPRAWREPALDRTITMMVKGEYDADDDDSSGEGDTPSRGEEDGAGV